MTSALVVQTSVSRDLRIGGGGQLRVRVFRSKHTHFEKCEPPNLVRMLSTESTYSKSSSSSNLKVPNVTNISPSQDYSNTDDLTSSSSDMTPVFKLFAVLQAVADLFAGFDNTCELSAVLGILANASCFNAAIQRNAKDVRSELRNKWGHCNFDHWTDVHFAYCFQVMEVMLRCLGLPNEDKQVDDLRDWESKGWLYVMYARRCSVLLAS